MLMWMTQGWEVLDHLLPQKRMLQHSALGSWKEILSLSCTLLKTPLSATLLRENLYLVTENTETSVQSWMITERDFKKRIICIAYLQKYFDFFYH